MKLNFSLRKTLGILLSAVIIMIFALYCSARVGYFLLSALILAPGFSVLISFYASSRLILTYSISHTTLNKGNTCVLTIELKNSGFLPSPPVDIKIADNPHLTSFRKKIRIYSLPRHEHTERIVFTARLAGGSYIGIEDAVLSDWFRICTFRTNSPSRLFKIGIIPDIIHRDADTDLLESVSDAYSSDRNDETVNESSFTFNGYAGYDYRPYEPGDPIKRINSKVSAKMGELMVRLDEKQASSLVNLIIDPYMEKEDALLAQNILESALGICFSLILLDFSVRLYYITDLEPQMSETGNEDDLHKNTKWSDTVIFSDDDLVPATLNLSVITFSDDIFLPSPEEIRSFTDKTCILISAGQRPEIKHMNIYCCSTGEWRHV